MDGTEGNTEKMSTMPKVAFPLEQNRILMVCKCVIDSRDKGLRSLLREYKEYKNNFLPKVAEAVREVVKNRDILVYSQQKWMVDQSIITYVNNLPFHPMTFHRQSVRLENDGKIFRLYLKTKQEGEVPCALIVPSKYKEAMFNACGEDNDALGQVELIEDMKYGRMRAHVTLRSLLPEPYKTEKWLGIDVGWNNLAVSAIVSPKDVTCIDFHGSDFKTRVIQLKYLLKEYQRSGRSWKKWDFRLKNVIKNAVGSVAKETVEKAKKNKCGVAMENLSFMASTKRWLIPRYKLQMAVKTLCQREGVPFKLVKAAYTSITCNKCGYGNKANRNGKNFKCLKCGYQTNADMNASVNIGREAIFTGYTLVDKTSRLYAEEGAQVARAISPEAAQRYG